MCTTANKLIFIETKRMEESFLGERARGLKFRSLKCALCQEPVQNTRVVVFECNRNFFNHSIHMDCVAAVMKREQAKSIKATEAKLRCPVCFKSNYDISTVQSERKLFKLD
jgi:cytochrome c-type biogenesis protein CcmH/NrfF